MQEIEITESKESCRTKNKLKKNVTGHHNSETSHTLYFPSDSCASPASDRRTFQAKCPDHYRVEHRAQ